MLPWKISVHFIEVCIYGFTASKEKICELFLFSHKFMYLCFATTLPWYSEILQKLTISQLCLGIGVAISS